MDGLDPACHHLLGQAADGTLLAYARLVPKGLAFAEASVGRVVTSPAGRGRALGHALMAQACAQLAALWGPQPIRIGAQAHLQAFYGQHGFVADGPGYIEDGIPHVEMLCPAPPAP
jgi:ElaA protein